MTNCVLLANELLREILCYDWTAVLLYTFTKHNGCIHPPLLVSPYLLLAMLFYTTRILITEYYALHGIKKKRQHQF